MSPVLMYHDIKTVPVNGFDVSTKDFAAQLDLLQSKGCTACDRLIRNRINAQNFPNRNTLLQLHLQLQKSIINYEDTQIYARRSFY